MRRQGMEPLVSHMDLTMAIDDDDPEKWGRGPFQGQEALGFLALQRHTVNLRHTPPHPLNRALTKVAGSVVV